MWKGRERDGQEGLKENGKQEGEERVEKRGKE